MEPGPNLLHPLLPTRIVYATHYNVVKMSAMASKITCFSIICSSVGSGANKKNQSSTSLAFVRGIHRCPVNSPHNSPITRKMFAFDYAIMLWKISVKTTICCTNSKWGWLAHYSDALKASWSLKSWQLDSLVKSLPQVTADNTLTLWISESPAWSAHLWPMDSSRKVPVMRKAFLCRDTVMVYEYNMVWISHFIDAIVPAW